VVTTDAFWVLVSGAFWVLVVLTVLRVGLWLRRRWREESARQDLIVSVVLGDTETTP
jgi:hypothetical protein